MEKIKGIIFDYGGTLDSFGNHWSEVIYDAYRYCGVEVARDAFRDAYVYAERLLARERRILPQFTFLDLMREKITIELEELERCGVLQPGTAEAKAAPIAERCYSEARRSIDAARPTLDYLAERYPMVLVSNFYGNVDSVVRDMDLRHYFRGIIESAVVGVRKPDARIFMLGVVALGLKPEEVLVVGDSYRKDIEPALSIGCKVAWLKGKGWTPEEDAVTHPSIIKNLSDLKALY